jgi:hypothetical protein
MSPFRVLTCSASPFRFVRDLCGCEPSATRVPADGCEVTPRAKEREVWRSPLGTDDRRDFGWGQPTPLDRAAQQRDPERVQGNWHLRREDIVNAD